jgi:hypothetical protein
MAIDSAHATSGQQDTLVAVWQGDPTPERMRAMGDQLRAIARANSGRVFLYNVITASTGMPSAETRVECQTQFASMRGQLMAASIVLEKTGLEGALSRTMLSTFITLSQRPFPMRVFAVPRDAALWLSASGSVASATAISSLADALRLKLRETSIAQGGAGTST